MICSGITPKRIEQNDNATSLILNSDNQNITDSKKFKKCFKNRKNNTAYIISKKINHFSKKIQSEKKNQTKIIKEKNNNMRNNNFRIFLYFKLKKKYDSENYTYNLKKINELIFNIPSKFTANFKDYLLIEEDAEFLKREYKTEEFKKKFNKIFYFYEKYSKTFPNYTILKEGKYMYKNILKKQKMVDELQKIKEEDEEKTNSRIMDFSNETIFTNNTIESINNQKDSFWSKKLQDIIYLDQNQEESDIYDNINIIINKINQFEKKREDSSNKQAIYKKEFKKIRNLSKPLYINQINPRLMQIKEKINQIKNYRNNFELNKKLKNKTIESSYNSFSTTVNNKSFNNKMIFNNTNINEEKKELLRKRIPCPKDLSYKKESKESKEKERYKERLSNLSNKYQKNNQNESKFSNSMMTNKVKNYFKINCNKKKQMLSSKKKSEYSYNIGSLFNSRKDRCKEFLTEKKLISEFNKYISNRTKPIKKNSYINTESLNSHHSHLKTDYIMNSQNNLNQKIYNSELYSKKSYEESINKIKSNYSLKKKNLNVLQLSFLNHTFSIKKNNKINKNDLSKYNKKFNKRKIIENISKNKIFLKSKILKNNKIKTKKQIFFSNINNKPNFILSRIKSNLGEKNYIKTFYSIKGKSNYNINNNTNASIEKQNNTIIQKKKNFGKKIILSTGHYGRNEKFINLKFSCGKTFHSNKIKLLK